MSCAMERFCDYQILRKHEKKDLQVSWCFGSEANHSIKKRKEHEAVEFLVRGSLIWGNKVAKVREHRPIHRSASSAYSTRFHQNVEKSEIFPSFSCLSEYWSTCSLKINLSVHGSRHSLAHDSITFTTHLGIERLSKKGIPGIAIYG
ncbi:hypothetical protein SS1G_08350 [Sclerotinia sclerotiorum 1980 UF-70]|uniref:Uncharacterized protein n=1 Tax=Sclerotinia sclerotiorum (strain ATCC 18683 / 1980 / Ss-1) TaxID=665079 RepID=A7ESP5_SCLS1|nr:hypothetical protein SS1G_08350 [Sclerotinia sclerotiorum 1980 UF-70]EDN92487.1 hypothetical protein SS1G_08350 [Sclerotinia sclerotiorum 1980 UF-70]